MSLASSVWFAIGLGMGALMAGFAWVPSSVESSHIMLSSLTEYQTFQNDLAQTRFLNLEGKHVPGTPMPKLDRFPSRFPLAGTPEVGSGFGWRLHPMTGVANLHEGLDFTATAGMPILAAASGKVLKAGWQGGYGLMVEISHGQSLTTRYAHAQAVHVRPGDWVGQGQMIAEVGSTGHSTGPHLHFEVRLQGLALDPGLFVGQDARLSLR